MKKNKYELINVSYNKEKNTLNGYVNQKNSMLILQSLNLIIKMIDNEYERSYEDILEDLKMLKKEIDKKGKEE